MCEIVGLKISGVRSFNPDPAKSQYIEFGSPFTLILGENGSGKTSIIETLNFITAGGFPPNSNNCGDDFFNITSSTVVKPQGEVILSFKSMGFKEIITAQRINYIYITQGGKKIKIQGVQKIFQGKTLISDSSSGDDFAVEMSNLLLTPASIIDKVCFAHQEEQEWLLDNNEYINKIFDELFDPGKFSEDVKLNSKEINNNPSLTKGVEQEIQEIDIEEHNSISFELDITKKDLENSIKLENQSSKEIEALNSKILSEKLDRKYELDTMERVYNEILQKYKGYNDLPQEELPQPFLNIVEQEEKLELILKSLSTNQMNLIECNQKLKNIENSYKLNPDYEVQICHNKKELKKLDKKLEEMLLKASDLNLISTNDISNKEGNDFNFNYKFASKILEVYFIKKQENETKKEINNERLKSQLLIEASRETKIKDLLIIKEVKVKEIAEIKDKIFIQKQTYDPYELNLSKIKKEIKDNKNKIEEWIKSLGKINKEIEKYQNLDVEKFKKMESEIQNLHKTRISNDFKIALLDIEIMQLSNRIIGIETSYKSLGIENEESFSTILDNEYKMLEKLYIDFEFKKFEIEVLEAQLSQIQQDLSKIEFSDEKIVQLFKDLESLGIQFECDLIHLNDNTKLNQIITIRNKIQAEEEKYQYLMKYYESLVIKTRESSSCIMLNHDMSENKSSDLHCIKSQIDPYQVKNREIILNLLENLIKELNKKIDCNKRRAEKSTIEEKSKSAESDNMALMIQINKTNENVKLLNKDKEKIRKHNYLKSVYKEKQTIRLHLAASKNEFDQRQGCLLLEYKKLQPLILDFKQKNIEKQELIEFISNAEKTRNELEFKKALIKKGRNHLNEVMPKTIEEAEKELEEINQKLGKCNQEMIKIANIKDEIAKENNKIASEINVWSNNLEFILDLDKVCKDYKYISEHIVNIDFEKIENISNEIKELTKLKSGIEEKIRKNEEEVHAIDKEITITKEKTDLKEKFAEYFTALNELKNIEKEKKENKEIFAEIEMNLEDIKLAKERFEKIKADVEFLQKRRNILEGKKESDKFTNVWRELHLENPDLIVFEQQSLQKQKLRDVPDSNTSKFLNERLDKINATIEKLWNTFRNKSNIKGIFVHHDSDFQEKRANSSSFRINFKLKNNGEEMLELKGRVSAGQKSLICTIVRIALCLVFAPQFPVIALDEPTKNLDYENRMALADCLRKLVNYFKVDRKFQFIIITQDQDFIKSLGHQIFQKYYQVSKDSEGYSQIESKDI